ncbi:MAG: phosphoserine phosphatase [Euryarchaeota archaeon]|nr:phosphoserine phosphatase [Euryarchaeota archaeon]
MEADVPVASLDELESKREQANAEAERHRRRRDDLNLATREWVEKRDALNGQVRALVEQATQHRQKRDELNAQVQAAKVERDKWNRRVNELLAKVNDLKRTRMPRGGIPIARLKREVRELEFRQQTRVLTPAEERALIDEMGRLQAEIRKREKELEQDEEVKKAIEELRAAKEIAEASHKRVGELAEAAQKEHDGMVALFEQSDSLRGEADAAQEEFIKTKMLADEEHRKHIEFIRQVHDYDKIIHGIRQKGRTGAEVEEVSSKRQAELIFERFRKGDKLSTEDLMILQKSGYM